MASNEMDVTDDSDPTLTLAEKLDKELNEMIDGMKKKNPNYKYQDEFSEESFSEMLETHPAFIKETPTQEVIDKSPLLQGLQQLKYEDGDEKEQALAYKEDGNWHFKKKMYSNAIKAYSEGLKKKCDDSILNSILLANRAAAHFHLKNYRSSVRDSLDALKLDPTKVKSMLRCAQCCDALEKHTDTIVWTKKVLLLDSDDQAAKDLLKKAQIGLKTAERDRRKKEKETKVKNAKIQALVGAIRLRGVRLHLEDLKPIDNDALSAEDLMILRSVDASNTSHVKVHFEDDTVNNLSENGKLVWPVLLAYPEHQVSEIIEEFTEDVTFLDHMELMFDDPAPWDTDGTYKVDELEIYHECGADGLCSVDTISTLREVLSKGRITVKAGTPMFIVLSKASPFKDIFLSRHRILY